MKSFFSLNALVLGKYAPSDKPLSDGLALYKKFSVFFDMSSIQNLTLEGKDEYIDGIYYYVPDEKMLLNFMRN